MKSFFKKSLLCLISTLVAAFASVHLAIASTASPISVAVFSGENKSEFETKIEPVLREQMKSCAGCSFKNITPYDGDGKLDLSKAHKQLEDAGSWSSFVFFNWNGKSTVETKKVVEALKSLVGNGKLVIASAGAAKESEPTLPLSRTIVGEVPGIIVIGDMGPNERLPVLSYFGPEMLTAVKPPKEYVGQGYGPVFFASKLATNWNKKNSADWAPHFQNTKSKTRRIWPALDDFFGRK